MWAYVLMDYRDDCKMQDKFVYTEHLSYDLSMKPFKVAVVFISLLKLEIMCIFLVKSSYKS